MASTRVMGGSGRTWAGQGREQRSSQSGAAREESTECWGCCEPQRPRATPFLLILALLSHSLHAYSRTEEKLIGTAHARDAATQAVRER